MLGRFKLAMSGVRKFNVFLQPCIELDKNKMNSHQCFKLVPWTKVSLDQCFLGQKSSWTNVSWTKWSLDDCPLDKCINTIKAILKMSKGWCLSRDGDCPKDSDNNRFSDCDLVYIHIKATHDEMHLF